MRQHRQSRSHLALLLVLYILTRERVLQCHPPLRLAGGLHIPSLPGSTCETLMHTDVLRSRCFACAIKPVCSSTVFATGMASAAGPDACRWHSHWSCPLPAERQTHRQHSGMYQQVSGVGRAWEATAGRRKFAAIWCMAALQHATAVHTPAGGTKRAGALLDNNLDHRCAFIRPLQ